MSNTPEMPDKDFDLIYADPPWRYDFSETTNREIENHYDTMQLEDIKNLDVPASEDCVLYLWATAPKLQEALEVIEAWGFDYKTHAIWDKKKIGMGYWFRGRHELLLVATKGSPSPPEPGERVDSVFEEERGEHSRKPIEVRRHLVLAHPDKRKIELFSRENHVDWEVWGDEVEKTQQHTLETVTSV